MANLKIRYLIAGILLIVTATLVSALQHDSSQDETVGLVELQKIPMQIGKWQGHDLPLDKRVYDLLETRAIMHRNYIDDKGNTILLSIVYYHDVKVGFHTPEACLGGRGERTSKKLKTMELKLGGKIISLEVAAVTATNHNGQGLSYYFYKTGSFMGQNYIRMRLSLAKNALLSGDKSGALIRFTGTYRNQDDRRQLEKSMQSLMWEMIPIMIEL